MNPPFENPEAFAAALCRFVNEELPRLHSRMSGSPGVGPDTPLFATGLLDSLAVLHVVGFVEDAIGRRLGIEEVVMSRFQNARTIARTFWTASLSPEESHAPTR